MTRLPELSRLSPAEKDALILKLWDRVQALEKRIEELEARLGRPPKSSRNSSLPPSRDRKANKPERPKGLRREASVGRAGGGRRLHPDPDHTVEARARACPHCHGGLPAAEQKPVAVYDRIEIPPVRPVVTRVRLYGGRCPSCGGTFAAPAPDGLEPGSPFGQSVAALAVYLRYVHTISYERLAAVFDHVFGLTISEGALANLFLRLKPGFDGQVAGILARLRRSRLICSDETSARVDGRTHWEWVFQNDDVSLHVVRRSRGRAVPEEILDGHRPEVWVSDLLGAQRGHADAWQMCLAHQLRNCQYAIEAGDAIFAPRLKRVLMRAVAIGRKRTRLKEGTLRQYRCDLERRMDACMALQPANRHGIRLRKRYGRLREHLFTFVTDPDVPYTNNGSERDLRPSVTFRKVTNGFRSDWGADFFAAVRSILDTGRRRGLTPLDAIRYALMAQAP
ncbi:MAG: IS66 family transposase [Alphaproteobacteria bacterium]